jgi:hypothetical protein
MVHKQQEEFRSEWDNEKGGWKKVRGAVVRDRRLTPGGLCGPISIAEGEADDAAEC